MDYCNWLAQKQHCIHVFAGMAGPTSAGKLMRYAKICGVSTSLRAVNSMGMNAVKLAMHASPDRHFSILSEHRAERKTGNLAGIHLFSFGGFVDSARWISKRIREA